MRREEKRRVRRVEKGLVDSIKYYSTISTTITISITKVDYYYY